MAFLPSVCACEARVNRCVASFRLGLDQSCHSFFLFFFVFFYQFFSAIAFVWDLPTPWSRQQGRQAGRPSFEQANNSNNNNNNNNNNNVEER